MKLTPLHAAYIEVGAEHPKAASSVLYQNYYLPDTELGTSLLTVCTYYGKGADIFIQLADFDKAFEFLTIALATGQKIRRSRLLEQLLLVTELARNIDNDLSRHIPAAVFEANKANMAEFSKTFASFNKDWSVETKGSRHFEALMNRGLETEVLAVIREMRERKIRDLKRVYLSVGAASICDSDTEFFHSKLHQLRLTSTYSGAHMNDVGLGSGSLDSEISKLSKQYVFSLIMTGAIVGSIEEEREEHAYNVTFSQNSVDRRTGKPFTLEAQISYLHDRLSEVTRVSQIMDAAGRDVVSKSRFKNKIWRKTSTNHFKTMAQDMQSSGDMEEEASYTNLMRLVGHTGHTSRGFELFPRRRSFQQMADDSQDVEGTDTSGVDTLDEHDEELV